MQSVREIKFRAWDKTGFTFYNPERFFQIMYYDVQDTYDNCEGDSKPDHRSFGELLKDSRFIVMQYTGLKDKNGKEVYEGDIVKTPYLGFEIAEIGWSGEGYWLKPKKDRGYWVRSLEYGKHIRVIGNIYENPELVGDK